MLFVNNKNETDPSINLALEEYVLKNYDTEETFLLFYINRPSIIIGKNQNTLEEINTAYVSEKNIQVVRRLSGGGAVYHDLENLNFSFISNYDSQQFNNYKYFTAPVLEVLHSLGIRAELNGRNDILLDGKKISGNAQYMAGKRMVSHGTLLFHSQMEEVVQALNVKAGKIESKGIKSVRSRITNIHDHLQDKTMTVLEFKQKLLEGLFKSQNPIPELVLSAKNWEEINYLADTKYRTWEWNYGKSPEFNLQKVKRFSIGEIDVRATIQNGYIKTIRIFGDFQGNKDIHELELLLMGQKYDALSLSQILEAQSIHDYFGSLDFKEFITLIY